jgi:hypothetical protein
MIIVPNMEVALYREVVLYDVTLGSDIVPYNCSIDHNCIEMSCLSKDYGTRHSLPMNI